MFNRIYQWIEALAAREGAIYYLQLLSFCESIFFPIPTDVMLVPVVYKHRSKAFKIAIFTTLFSVLGGVVGYFLGEYSLEIALPLIERFGWVDHWQRILVFFEKFGAIAIIVAAFTPIPFKVVTVAAGASGVGFILFLLCATVGRFTRFSLVTWLVCRFGDQAKAVIDRWIEPLGWIIIGVVVLWFGVKL